MKNVTALKSYGQHFLVDKSVLEQILNTISKNNRYNQIIEIGPGTGALTEMLLSTFTGIKCIEVDKRCVEFLNEKYKTNDHVEIIDQDVLKTNFEDIIDTEAIVVGNFPYNISSQIIFKVLEYKEKIPVCIGMFQKEMATRLAAKHGNKDYGIITILTKLYYDVEIEFDIFPNSFSPPPKVMSSVITLKRKENVQIDFNLKLFTSIVKSGFNQRRKMLRSGLKGIVNSEFLKDEFFNKRAEQLSIQDFIDLTNRIEKENG